MIWPQPKKYVEILLIVSILCNDVLLIGMNDHLAYRAILWRKDGLLRF